MQHGTDADADACVALWVEAVAAREGTEPPAGTAERARSKFARPRVSWRVLRDAERLLGFALVTAPGTGNVDDPPEAGYLGLLAVHPAAAGRGSGRALLEAVMADAAALGLPALVLHVLIANTRAVRMYEAAGWIPDGPTQPHPLSGEPFQRFIRPTSGRFSEIS